MAEINQPTPVKPVWPTRREQHPLKRGPRDQPGEDDLKRRKDSQHEKDGEKPGIDEYV